MDKVIILNADINIKKRVLEKLMVATSSLREYLGDVRANLKGTPYQKFQLLRRLYEQNTAIIAEVADNSIRDIRFRRIVADVGEKALALYDLMAGSEPRTRTQEKFLEDENAGVLRLQRVLGLIESADENYWLDDDNWSQDDKRLKSNNRPEINN